MFGGLPFYRNYQPQGYSPYHPLDLERAQALAAQRAKRAQWLPDEYDDDVDDYRLHPHERAYLNAHRDQTLVEQERQRRQQKELEARRRAEEEQRWQRELDRRQKEDEAARIRLEEEKQRRRQSQRYEVPDAPSHNHFIPDQSLQPHSPKPSHPHQIPLTDGRIPSPLPEKPTSPPAHYDEKHEEAASKLQHHFRTRQSIRAIKNLSSQFDNLRKEFTYPSIVSFQNPSSPPTSANVIDVPAAPPSQTQEDNPIDVDSDSPFPKLAYNSTNYNLHAYIDSLDQLLVKLDGVESWGDSDVRARRRSVVKRVELEQARLDRFWRESWLEHLKSKGEWVDGDMPVYKEEL